MKKAAIVSIGNEILSGQTVDTNAAYLSRELLRIGVPVVGAYTVGDDVDAIVRALGLASDDADVVLATGGLGPTDDDVTRDAFAKFLNVELELQEELLDDMRAFFARRNRRMSARNEVQACIPAGTTAMPNDRGTAPGIMAQGKGGMLIAMPGVPGEMKQMFGGSVLPQLESLAAEQSVVVRKLRCFGTGESNVAELLGPVMERGRNPLVNCTVERGVIILHIVAAGASEEEAGRLAEKQENALRAVLGDLVYGVDEQSLGDVVGVELARRGKTVATAESCTGGAVAKLLTDSSGASEYFTHGWVTYSNEAKISELGVAAELIDRHGAVSEEVARAMARGARERAGSDFAISITGIAGPTGATAEKPVGLVYICVDSEEECEVRECRLSGDRSSVRGQAAKTALNMLRLIIGN